MAGKFVIRLADVNIEVVHRYRRVKQMCSKYIVDDDPEFTVSVTDDEIRADRERNPRPEKRKPKLFTRRYYEATALYRKICLKLMDYDAFLLHAAVVAVDGEGYAFLAKSGTGKSTHARFWLKYFGSRAFMVNGDKPILRIYGDKVIAYGTPWCGKENLNANTGVPLKAIFFLERGQGTTVTKMPGEKIPERIASQLLITKNGKQRARVFELADRVMALVSMYRLSCDMDPDTARIAWESMQEVMRNED
ncbi:MAG: hypothetical protein Q4G19_02815 [Clostridia bacterium]|nr:hypothetical protein [Clostridia bacterium]